MAIDKRLQIKDEQGNLVDYDILASDVKFMPDGKDLPTKLAELEDDIEDAGSGDGTVTGVKIGSTTYEPTDGVVDLSSPMSDKVDKNGTDSLMTAAEHTKLGNLPTATELATQMNAKANDNAVVKTISVNGGTPATPVNGNVNISVQGAAGEDGITPHIGSNGNWWIGPETDPTNDTGIKAQGPAGTSYTSADLEIGNALNGEGNVLGMSGAMRIKSNIDSLYTSLNRLYTKLANMAFWDSEDQEDAAPTPVDWSIPQITVTLDKTSLSANAMITDASDQEITGTSVLVDEGSGLTLKIKPRNGYGLTAATATIGGVAQALTESNGVYTLVINSVTEAITIAISATTLVEETVTLVNADGNLELSRLTVLHGDDYEGILTIKSSAPSNCELPSSISATIGGVAVDFTASGNSYDPTDGSITIANVSGALVITAAAAVGWSVAPKNDTSAVNGIQNSHTIQADSGQVLKDASGKTILCPRGVADQTSSIAVSPGSSPMYYYAVHGNEFQLKMKPLVSGCYALNVGYYASDYSFISRDSYKDVGTNEDWETSFNLPANAAYVKVLVCRRDSYGGTVQEMQTIYDSWDGTTMQYK